MSVFPNYVKSLNSTNSDLFLIKHMEDNWDNHSAQNLHHQAQADIDLRFFSNDQTIWNDMYGTDIPYNRGQHTFNLIKRIVEMPSGYQRENRKSTIAVPIEGSDQKTADQFTKLLMWNDQQDNVSETISEAFEGALITGMNLLQVWVDYSRDPISGDIKVDNVPFNAFIIDPYFRKMDLSDCRFIWKRSFVTHEQAMALLPNQEENLQQIGIASQTDGKFMYMPESLFYGAQQNLLIYDEYFYRSFRKATHLNDQTTGATIEWTGENNELQEYLRQFPNILVTKGVMPTVKQGIVVQGKVFYHGGNLLGIDDYSFVPTLAYYTPELNTLENRIQGLVRPLRDTQFLFNRTMINMLDIWDSQPNSGWVAKEDSVINPKALFKTGQGQVIWRKKHSEPDDLIKMPPANIPQGFFEINSQLNQLTQWISGVNEELLGSATDEKAGILSMLRQGAGLLTLRRLFDQLDVTQSLLGRLRIKIMQNNFTPGKVQRILAEEPTQQFYDRDFGVYDGAVEEGFNTTTQKQLEFAQLMSMKEAGVLIPDERILAAAPIQNKDEIMQEVQQRAQALAQQEQAQSQAVMQEQQATVNMANAQADYQEAGARERDARIGEITMSALERMAEAEKDTEQALLNKVKTLKELDEIDLKQVEKLVSIAKMLKEDKIDAKDGSGSGTQKV